MKEAIAENSSYQDFLLLVLEDEYLYRSNRRSEMLKRRAKFKDQALLESFEADPKRGVSKSMIKQLQTLQFMSSFKNIVLYGGTGAGQEPGTERVVCPHQKSGVDPHEKLKSTTYRKVISTHILIGNRDQLRSDDGAA